MESIQAAAVACIFPDLAFYNDVPLGVDGSFYPFGTTPMVYDKFYIGSQTAFSKKKSLVHINFDLAPLERLTDNPTVPQLSWEYWNGKGWTRLETFAYGLKANGGEFRFESSGSVSFACPVDLEKTEVNGKENYWIRVRLIGGNYGTASYTPNGKMSVNSIKAPKILKISINVNIDQDHFYPLEYCITKNNLNTLSVDLSKPFQPFQVLDSQIKHCF